MSKSTLEWTIKEGALVRTFTFEDFIQATSFMMEIAIIAQLQRHHPYTINDYNKVEYRLWTTDAGNVITEKDYRLARTIDEAYVKYHLYNMTC